MHNISDRIDAILLAAHGSVRPEALRAYEHLKKRFAVAFAPLPIRLAITSKRVGGKLDKEGRSLPLIPEAIAAMKAEGFKRIAIQSLHVTPAELFEKMREKVSSDYPDVIISRPMLGSQEDLKSFADAIFAILPGKRPDNEAVMLMGHGRIDGLADPLYLALAQELQARDSRVFLTNLAGSLDFPSRRHAINTAGFRKVRLQSLLVAVGHHVMHDMIGDQPESLSSQLTADGLEVIPVIKGLGEYDIIADLLINRLTETIAAAKK